jgi:hypothetical protein
VIMSGVSVWISGEMLGIPFLPQIRFDPPSTK